MTLDELDRLAAEKLDKLAAIHVMGWTLVTNEWAKNREPLEPRQFTSTWKPTRNISQAWECLEKTAIRFKVFRTESFGVYVNLDTQTYHQAKTLGEWEYHDEGQSICETIVRACLKAKGVEL